MYKKLKRLVKPLLSHVLKQARRRGMHKVLLIGMILFGVLNVGVFLMYRNQTFPNTQIAGRSIGSAPFDALPSKIASSGALPNSITVTVQAKKEELKPSDLGVTVDARGTADAARQARRWLPVLNFFGTRQVPLVLKAQDAILDKKLQELAVRHQKKPIDARVLLSGTTFSIRNDQPGYQVDVSDAKSALLAALAQGTSTFLVPTKSIPPKHTAASLAPALSQLQAQQKTVITYAYQGKRRVINTAEISSWYEPTNTGYALSIAKIQGSLVSVGVGFGIGVKDIEKVVAQTKQAVTDRKPTTITLQPAPLKIKKYTYCVAGRGVPTNQLNALISKLAAVYTDSRGWGLNGQVHMTRATSNCDFTVWLSAASQMPGFGPICDSTWSCRVGSNVVINFDRWQGASPAWNAAGGKLDDYRSMVINHETGHWLGFGHPHCTGAGQLAPVMQQQSINLEGCRFNPWPLPSERAALKASLAL